MIKDIDLSTYTLAEKQRILELYRQQEDLSKFNYIDQISYEKYPKHKEFFKAGKDHKFRLIMAGNQVGKSLACSYELVCHLTGEYPSWWEGKRLSKATNFWVCGENTALLRQSIIQTLLGPVGEFGTGLIRHKDLDFDSLSDTQKLSTTITDLRVKHKSGKFSQVSFKSYDSGRTAFQAFRGNILCDEEPPVDVWNEIITRTITLGDDGLIIMNFTPMKGEGELLTKFLEGAAIKTGEISSSKHLTNITWDDAPHLSEKDKAELIKEYPKYMVDARTKGLPMLGSGAIYPIAEEQVFIDPLPFSIPDHWKRFAAVDFGWSDPTVVLWFAKDPDSGITYQYNEHYLSEASVGTHAEIIKAQNSLVGFQIPIVCDPSGGGRSIADGTQTRQLYSSQYGIIMVSADNAIESGIARVFQTMLDGKFKVYNTCVNTRKEFRSYARSKNGFSGADHAMDCWRYGMASGQSIARSKTQIEQEKERIEKENQIDFDMMNNNSSDSWMSR